MEDSAARPGGYTFHSTPGFLLSDWKILIIIVHSVLLNLQIHGYTNEVENPARVESVQFNEV